MDDNSSDDAPLAAARRALSPQRPRRGAKPAGFYKSVNPLRPAMTSRSNILPKERGKRKRVESSPSGDEGDEGEHGGGCGSGSGMSDDGNGDDESEDDGEDNGEVKGKDSGKGDGRSGIKAKGKPGRKVKIKKEEPRERTPPSECEARPIKKDRDLKIIDNGSKMKEGDEPRYYAKVARVIERRDVNGKNPYDKTIEENYRMPDHPPVLLPAVDLSLLKTPDCTHKIPDRELVRFVMGPMVLPLLKQWAFMWLNPDNESKQFHKDMRGTFPMEGEYGKSWGVGIALIAEHAAHQGGFTFSQAPLLYSMSSFAQRLVNANGAFFKTFSAYSLATDEPHKFAVRLLLVVWDDVENNRDGFFRVLFEGELARPNRPEMREVYEGWYVVNERLFR